MIRNLILLIGWPVLIGGSIFLVVKGNETYKYVKGSLVGKISRVLVITTLCEMYSLGIVTTLLMFADVNYTYVGIPIFAIWFVTFIWTVKVISQAGDETKKLINS